MYNNIDKLIRKEQKTMSDILSALALAVSIFTAVFVILLYRSLNRRSNAKLSDDTVHDAVRRAVEPLGSLLSSNQRDIGDMQTQRFAAIDRALNDMRATVDRRLDRLRTDNTSAIDRLRSENNELLEKMRRDYTETTERLRRDNTSSLEKLRTENNEQLALIRGTVDEKLQETLEARITRSFKLVSERLEQVYKGLGEMQTLAQGVGDLKKVLSNVKTRGILGEIQLGSIIEQIMPPEQYSTNVCTVPGSRNAVEFAVKLPDRSGAVTYLPIDSKFPGDTYTALIDAYDSGSKEAVDNAAKALKVRMLSEAKDIKDKYVSPPSTTDFAVMFLPFEGLYSEAVNRGMVEELQSKYKIMLAGPSTMAAMLNSIQMGFKTLAIEKRSAEVWEILGAVKTEFSKFEAVLESAQKRINQANSDLDKLIGVRTRAIVRKLGSVETLEAGDGDMLGLSDNFEE